MLLLDHETVRKALPVSAAVPLMAEAMRRFSAGLFTQPLRQVLRPETDPAMFAVMPAHAAPPTGAAAEDGFAAEFGGLGGFGLKAIMFKPGNPAKGLPAHVGAVFLFDPETGELAAILDAAALTAVRTAAVSAVAARELARPDAGDLAILGAGAQARSHLEAMAEVRTLRRIRVWNRTRGRGDEFAAWAAGVVQIPVEVSDSPAAALAGADLVCTTMASTEPVVAAADLAEGAHVNAVGASVRSARELHAAAVARCSVFVDSRESAAAESADLLAPIEEGLSGPGQVWTEIGEVLLGRAPGRGDQNEITLYKSLGMAGQDVTAGFAVLRHAVERGLGRTVDAFEG
jgi:ornithine cyclodeaminase